MIPVTRPFLVPIEEYQQYLHGIWERQWLTNHGPLVLELEEKLKQKLGQKHIFYLNNGTIALQIAIKALGLQGGDIITTPFSYVATTSCIVWESCRPVYVDIEPDTLTIDPTKIEAAITPNTVAIMATHVYGIPCDVDAIEAIAKKHNLKVIYDAAHAFGVSYNGRPILDYGDVSTLSFHATKLFHTVEGGAVSTPSDEIAHKLSYMRNFGHNGPEDFFGVGINGKSSEFHAAMGLSMLPYVPQIIEYRKQVFQWYAEGLQAVAHRIARVTVRPGTDYNYAYHPVVFENEKTVLAIQEALKAKGVLCRRYFYPSLNTIPYVNGEAMPISEDISRRVLCLPLYHGLKQEEVAMICDTITATIKTQ